jgi:hypothetical protein
VSKNTKLPLWNGALIEKLVIAKLVKKLLLFYGIGNMINCHVNKSQPQDPVGPAVDDGFLRAIKNP